MVELNFTLIFDLVHGYCENLIPRGQGHSLSRHSVTFRGKMSQFWLVSDGRVWQKQKIRKKIKVKNLENRLLDSNLLHRWLNRQGRTLYQLNYE